MSEKLFIVDGLLEINAARNEYNRDMRVWESHCHRIESSFFTKTSRVATNKDKTNIKEYTYWYRSGSSIKSFGKEKPDIESMFPPKPQDPVQFEYEVINNRHILVSSDDLEKHFDLFTENFIFPFKGLLPLSGGSDINV